MSKVLLKLFFISDLLYYFHTNLKWLFTHWDDIIMGCDNYSNKIHFTFICVYKIYVYGIKYNLT